MSDNNPATAGDPNASLFRPDAASPRARYIMIGGFLGAGKTTAVARLANYLSGQGLRVGLITNDQGEQLVDTAILSSRGFPTEEIAGGCFCCRFNSLLDAARKLSATTRPDVFLAEPVGSCTDLVATVTYPLRRIYGDAFSIAPLSVLVDPIRAARVLGLQDGQNFSERVMYIYRKQLEEADVIVINKRDLVDTPTLAKLRSTVAATFPQAELFEISARQGVGLEPWFSRIISAEQQSRGVIDINYDTYAEGEALLGWLNATVAVEAVCEIDGNGFLRELSSRIQHRLQSHGAQIAHLKMTLEPQEGIGDLGVISLVRSDYVAELSQELIDPFKKGRITINLRAEVSPELLRDAVSGAITSSDDDRLRFEMEHLEYFRPGKPIPTHRDTGPAPTHSPLPRELVDGGCLSPRPVDSRPSL